MDTNDQTPEAEVTNPTPTPTPAPGADPAEARMRELVELLATAVARVLTGEVPSQQDEEVTP